jgi:hypothetical protein
MNSYFYYEVKVSVLCDDCDTEAACTDETEAGAEARLENLLRREGWEEMNGGLYCPICAALRKTCR